MTEKQEHPILHMLDGPQKGQHWSLNKDEIIVGRDSECDVSVPERAISRQHVRIRREGDHYVITDLNSRNGTWVQGQRLEGSRPLNDGDVIQLAVTIKLQFLGSSTTAPLPFAIPEQIETGVPINGKLRLDLESRRVFVGDTELDPPLSLPQYRLLELLYIHTGRICTRETVVATVWPDVASEGVSEQAIDALVRRLRDRLGEIDADNQYIVTVRGHGFRLDNPEADS
ncbi:MAG: FHA domain-containing protein [Chloroflexi bacterium]|nr:FHA domain-containing protein [Chloroflexota bacterium]